MLPPTGTLGVAVWENLIDNRWRWEGELIAQFAHEVPQELLETVGAMSGRFAEAANLRAALEGAGFSDVTIERMDVDPHVRKRRGVVGVVVVGRRPRVLRGDAGGRAGALPRGGLRAPGGAGATG